MSSGSCRKIPPGKHAIGTRRFKTTADHAAQRTVSTSGTPTGQMPTSTRRDLAGQGDPSGDEES